MKSPVGGLSTPFQFQDRYQDRFWGIDEEMKEN
jgi:hypothetical protein